RKLAEHWRRWAKGNAIVKRDVDITSQDIRTANLILVGNVHNNCIIQRINGFLPIRFAVNEPAVVMSNGVRVAGDDVGIKMLYPNPLNPNRLIVIMGGTTWKGTVDVMRRFGNWFDWGLLDHRNWFDFGIFDSRTRDPETFIAVGFFDQDWQLSDELTFYGDLQRRKTAPPQRTPASHWVTAESGAVYLSDLKPLSYRSDKGPLAIDRSVNGYPLTLGGVRYEKGIGVHPDAEVVYDIGGRFRTFQCVVGIDTEGEKPVSKARESAETVTFQIWGDGKLLAEVRDVKWNTPPKRIYVSVEGVRILKLIAKRQGGARWLYGNVDFADAKLGEEPLHYSGSVGAHLLMEQIMRAETSIEPTTLPQAVSDE
ncbi:MAG TPA: hypothetical protein EYP10_00680, partial [Armatimonadetes bacterium]|nr:hypothetical protein [Armatimonadota bacterium]